MEGEEGVCCSTGEELRVKMEVDETEWGFDGGREEEGEAAEMKRGAAEKKKVRANRTNELVSKKVENLKLFLTFIVTDRSQLKSEFSSLTDYRSKIK